jgi:flagellar basal body P-ring protein FlgI
LEESILQREVENNFDVLRDKHSNSVTNLEKARIWKNVTSKINALGVAPRSVKGLLQICHRVRMFIP